MPRVGIALGSNLGNRLKNLQQARDLLREISTGPLLQASVYRTEPIGCPPGSPDFYNGVVEISYDGQPGELLAITQEFQRKLGRTTLAERNAPRLIDIDLLYFGEETIVTPDLELPHPRLTLRRFVLQPLAEIRPDLILPGDSKTIVAHLAERETVELALDLVETTW